MLMVAIKLKIGKANKKTGGKILRSFSIVDLARFLGGPIIIVGVQVGTDISAPIVVKGRTT